MTSKSVTKIPIHDKRNDVHSFIPLGIVDGKRPGPTVAVISGIHATEYAPQDGVARFWSSLDPDELSGRVLVVLAADVMALCAHHMYTNPVDGNNLNRIYPGDENGTMGEVIAHTLMEQVVAKSDVIIDSHGGEFDETMGFYVITSSTGDQARDKKSLDLAIALGLPFIEVTQANLPTSGDQSASGYKGRGTLQGEAARVGRLAAVIEVGDARRDPWTSAITYNALRNALKHVGLLPGKPAPIFGTPRVLEDGLILKSTQAGLYRPEVVLFDWIEQGAVFARILDFDGSVLEEVRTPGSGVVLTVINSRAVKAGGFAGKVGAFSP
jgi:uncharacterized protein